MKKIIIDKNSNKFIDYLKDEHAELGKDEEIGYLFTAEEVKQQGIIDTPYHGSGNEYRCFVELDNGNIEHLSSSVVMWKAVVPNNLKNAKWHKEVTVVVRNNKETIIDFDGNVVAETEDDIIKPLSKDYYKTKDIDWDTWDTPTKDIGSFSLCKNGIIVASASSISPKYDENGELVGVTLDYEKKVTLEELEKIYNTKLAKKKLVETVKELGSYGVTDKEITNLVNKAIDRQREEETTLETSL